MSPRKKDGVPPEVAAAAAALGRLGGLAKTKKQQATRAANGAHNVPARIMPRGITRVQRWHLKNIEIQGGEIRTAKQQQAFDAVERLRQQEPQS